MPKETRTTTSIVKTLNAIPQCYAKKTHGGKFSSGEPDIVGCLNGRAFYVEVKHYSDGSLTPLQAYTLDLIAKSGAVTEVWAYDEERRIIAACHHDRTVLDYWQRLPPRMRSLFSRATGGFEERCNDVKDLEALLWSQIVRNRRKR